MKVGTKSLLFGTHQFLLHPLMVARGWRRAYGRWPWDWKLWLCFLVHDWGYWGPPNMDGAEGQLHPERGALLVAVILGPAWRNFCLGHSRYYARRFGLPVSPLMRADKLATALLPRTTLWLLATLSGEGEEYVAFHTRAGYPVDDVWDWAGNLRRLWLEDYG